MSFAQDRRTSDGCPDVRIVAVRAASAISLSVGFPCIPLLSLYGFVVSSLDEDGACRKVATEQYGDFPIKFLQFGPINAA
jgi:hypothetical protein